MAASLPQQTATKADQYRLKRANDYKQFKGPSVNPSKPMKTTERVEKTLQRLNECLKQLEPSDRDSIDSRQLERIKMCSLIFSDIIKDSGNYQPLLADIKKAYDCRLDSLLKTIPPDTADPLHHGSSDGVASAPAQSSSDSELAALKQHITLLEQQANVLLEENKRLNEEMIEEMKSLSETKSTTESLLAKDDQKSSTDHGGTTAESDYAAQVEKLHFQLWQCRKEIMHSMSQRTGKVPIDVHNQLEHCIRATELQIQRYRKQNVLFRDEIQGLEKKLQKYLEVCRIPRDDLITLWTTFEQGAVEFAQQV